MTIIELLRAQRELRLTCEELAETLGFARNTINQWRRGIAPIRQSAADRITAILAMPEAERENHIFRKTVRYRRAG